MAPALIGLCGYAGAGKDTVGSMIVKALAPEYWYVCRAFATALRAQACQNNPLLQVRDGSWVRWNTILEEAGGYERAKRIEPCVRAYLIELGQSTKEVMGEDYWVNTLFHGISRRSDEGDLLLLPTVITDVRFTNEQAAIMAREGIIVRVIDPRVGPANDTEREQGDIMQHGVDYTIRNDGTLEQLRERVDVFLATWFHKQA
jgi:hypothetical protein